MKTPSLLIVMLLGIVGIAAATSLNFSAPLPSATNSTIGMNQQLEIQKAAMQEIRTKMENWAAFTGYSSGSGR